MAKGKLKHDHIADEKRADETAAMASQVHFSAVAVCGFLEKMFGELSKKAA